MFPIVRIIHKVWVQKFYERHALLLFFVFYLMFGLVESSQLINYHFSLILASLTSPIFLWLIFVIWILYLIKMILFLEEQIALPQNSLLNELGKLKKRKQFFLYGYTVFLCYEPVFVYSLFMVGIALRNDFVLSGVYIIFFHLVFIGLSAWRILYTINSSSPSFLKWPSLLWPFVKPFPFFYLGLLFDRFKLMLLLTKIFSILCILGFLQLPVDHYEPRLAFLGITFGLFAHAVIVFEWRKFEDRYLVFTRGLPLSSNYLFAIKVSAYCLLLLPEWVVMVVQHVHVVDSFVGFLLSLGFLLFMHGHLYRSSLSIEKYQQTTLWLFLSTFMLALSQLALPASLIYIFFAWWQFRKNSETYEPASNLLG